MIATIERTRRRLTWRVLCVAVLAALALAVAGSLPGFAQTGSSQDNAAMDEQLDLSMGTLSDDGGPLQRPSQEFDPWPGHRGGQPVDLVPVCVPSKQIPCP